MKQWYVVQSHSHGEEKAERHLVRQGFETYLPRYLKRRRHARKTDWVKAPLFPGYLFVSVDIETARWRAILSTVGVSHLISHNGRPAPLDDAIVALIRARENEHGLVQIAEPARWRKGQKLKIAVGPMADLDCLFDGMDDHNRVVVLLSLMGREVRTRVPAEALQAIA